MPWCIKIDTAAQAMPELEGYRDKRGKIDLKDPGALNVYNQAVARVMADLKIEVPPGNLIPAVCLRQAYLVCLADSVLPRGAKILEIGTGASAIIAMLASKLYGYEVIATEIDPVSIVAAQNNINRNNLGTKIRLVASEGQILRNLVEEYGTFDAVVTYPPTYPDHDADRFVTSPDRGYQGTVSEMIGGGSEGFDFISQFLHEAVELKEVINYITIMLIFEEHVEPATRILETANYSVNLTKILAGSRTRYLIIATKSNPL